MHDSSNNVYALDKILIKSFKIHIILYYKNNIKKDAQLH